MLWVLIYLLFSVLFFFFFTFKIYLFIREHMHAWGLGRGPGRENLQPDSPLSMRGSIPWPRDVTLAKIKRRSTDWASQEPLHVYITKRLQLAFFFFLNSCFLFLKPDCLKCQHWDIHSCHHFPCPLSLVCFLPRWLKSRCCAFSDTRCVCFPHTS